jgi:hypothetical protein
MHLKQSGHYFCDRCDDIAFARFCQMCHEPARWVSSCGRPAVGLAKKSNLVSEIDARGWFGKMRQTVNAAPQNASGVE